MRRNLLLLTLIQIKFTNSQFTFISMKMFTPKHASGTNSKLPTLFNYKQKKYGYRNSLFRKRHLLRLKRRQELTEKRHWYDTIYQQSM